MNMRSIPWELIDFDPRRLPELGRPAPTPTFDRPVACAASAVAVAVIVTCHDYGRYLRECLDSVLAQTIPCEVILVDDASTDNTRAIAAEFAPRVRYLRTEFRDVALARNAGADASGNPTHYAFIDADDVLPRDYLKKLLAAMTDPRVGVTYSHLEFFGDRTGRAPYVHQYDRLSLHYHNFINAAALVRRTAFEQVGGWRSYQHGLQDWELWQRIAAGGWQMQLCDDVALGYRKHGDSMTDAYHRGGFNADAVNAIVRCVQLTSIVTLFSGRDWNLARWFDSLARLEWDHDHMHLVAIDNSQDPAFSARLRSKLAAGTMPFTYAAYRESAISGRRAVDFLDSASLRTQHAYRLGVHLARLYAFASQYLPVATAKVWSIEDDVETPPDSLRLLMTDLYAQAAGAVSGVLRSRFGANLLTRKDQQLLQDAPSQPVAVSETGFYCLLTHRHVWDSIAWRPGEPEEPARPYYDWAACHDIQRTGPVVLVPSVRCRHWQADGTAVDV